MTEKTPAQKLLIKPGKQVRLVNPPSGVLDLLGGLPEGSILIGSEPAGDDKPAPADFVILFANNRAELETLLLSARGALAPTGALWVAYHKGTSPVKTDIHRDSINTYARSLGMEGVAMISMNEDWSALRLKIIR